MATPASIRNQLSIDTLVRVLTDVIAEARKGQAGGQRPGWLTAAALRSQGSLAKLSAPDAGLHSMSLNTCKRTANLTLPGGFAQLDDARKLALHILQSASESTGSPVNARSKDALARKIVDLEESRDGLLEDLSHLSGAFYFAVQCARKYAIETGKPDALARFKLDESEIFSRASLIKAGLHLVEKAPHEQQPAV